MPASVNDKITDTRNSARPVTTTVTSLRSAAGTTLACQSLTGWPTASKVHFVTYQLNSSKTVVANTQLDCYGIVSGSSITNLSIVDGTDGGNSVGDYVEMLPTAGWGQDLSDGLLVAHDRAGTHKSGATYASPAFSGTVTGTYTLGGTPTIAAGAWLSAVYPIGSIYTSVVSTNPNTLFSFGTWTAFASGRTLVGLDSGQAEFDTVEETGGAKTHTLLTAEMPAHTHGLKKQVNLNFTGSGLNPIGDDGAFGGAVTDTTGGGGAHNNLQPYIVVYMWKRTA